MLLNIFEDYQSWPLIRKALLVRADRFCLFHHDDLAFEVELSRAIPKGDATM